MAIKVQIIRHFRDGSEKPVYYGPHNDEADAIMHQFPAGARRNSCHQMISPWYEKHAERLDPAAEESLPPADQPPTDPAPPAEPPVETPAEPTQPDLPAAPVTEPAPAKAALRRPQADKNSQATAPGDV